MVRRYRRRQAPSQPHIRPDERLAYSPHIRLGVRKQLERLLAQERYAKEAEEARKISRERIKAGTTQTQTKTVSSGNQRRRQKDARERRKVEERARVAAGIPAGKSAKWAMPTLEIGGTQVDPYTLEPGVAGEINRGIGKQTISNLGPDAVGKEAWTMKQLRAYMSSNLTDYQPTGSHTLNPGDNEIQLHAGGEDSTDWIYIKPARTQPFPELELFFHHKNGTIYAQVPKPAGFWSNVAKGTKKMFSGKIEEIEVGGQEGMVKV